MILPDVATPRTKKPAAKKPGAKPPDPAERKRSLFAEVGEEARREAQRKLLLKTLREHDWSLKATAEALGIGATAPVIRALQDLAPEEYAAAQADGRIKPGRRFD